MCGAGGGLSFAIYLNWSHTAVGSHLDKTTLNKSLPEARGRYIYCCDRTDAREAIQRARSRYSEASVALSFVEQIRAQLQT